MERESFEDEEVAKVLNENYISIKVDREERPDIDNIYMTFCQATTGRGGWPLNVFLTSNKEPFYSGTYFPKQSHYNMIGIVDLLNTITDKWNNNYDEIFQSVKSIMYFLKQENKGHKVQVAHEESIKKAYEYFKDNYDVNDGGFGSAPKFPSPHNLMFLLRYYKVYDDDKGLDMVESTLIKMYKGGIFDHIGFGFSRYSVDSKWLVPHFEKMLYDNAMLIMAYVEAYQVTQKSIYKEVADKIITYVTRDMVHEEGGFLSAEDADSEGVEGKFYVWTPEEMVSVLGESEGRLYNQYYDVTVKGNFEGSNIPNLIDMNINVIEDNPKLKEQLEACRKKLFEYRKKRVHPYKDDKILTAWNGLMIRALALAGKVFHNESYIDAATKAVSFIEKHLMDGAKIHARFRDGERKHLGYLDDYSFMIWAYLELYDATFNVEFLKKSYKLAKVVMEEFEDKENHGYFIYSSKSEQLILRPKEIYDGAMPSGQSVLALAMQKLSIITGDENLKISSENIFKTFSERIHQSPMSHTMMLCAMMLDSQPIREIVITSTKYDKELDAMIHYLNGIYAPFTVKIKNDGKETSSINEFARDKEVTDNPTIYICQNFACEKPVDNLDNLKEILNI